MDQAVLEQEAKKLFGGGIVNVKPFQDAGRAGWDLTIVPHIDGGLRFIRLSSAEGMNGAMVYLKKIQQNLLKLNHNGMFGMNPIEEKIDQSKVDEEIQKRMPTGLDKYACEKCGKTFKHAGIFGIHKNRHKEPSASVAGAPNDPMIYNAA